ncbi:MAG: carboxypeptidase regulatory-like domain-containing protein, partial [Candidatus Cloacimonetes bacterium]|nr:carboxypeptidase regulatory-like domain-containing protein [Candidatus Cloacimonadota bacterium]
MNKRMLVTLILSVFVLGSLFANMPNKPDYAIEPDGSSDFNIDPNQSVPNTNGTREQWDLQFDYDVDAGTGTTGNSGSETDGTYLYTTVWNSDGIAKWDLDGTFIELFTIPGVSALRDLAYDGTYFYGGNASNHIWEMDFDAQTLISTIQAPGPVRSICYDESADAFWVNNWSTALLLVDRSGSQIDQIETVPSMYGSAYDPYSNGGPYLWFFTGTATGGGCMFEQYDMEGTATGVTFDPQGDIGGAISGGLWIYGDLYPGVATIGGCAQGDDTDRLFGFELCNTAPPEAPGAPTDFTVTPDAGGALSADLAWTNPSLNASGAALTELTEMRVYRDGVLVHTITTPTIGGPEAWTDTTVPVAGEYDYSVVGFNTEGEGLPVTASEWVGEDVPSAVTGLTLASDDGNGLLTWVNPTTGLHGGVFNEPILGYTLVRSDGAPFDLVGIMTTYTDDTIPTDDNYSYTLTPFNVVGEGGAATSNEMWIGSSVGVTIGTATTSANNLPLDYYWKNSLSETIYMASELAAGGITGGGLTHIVYYYNFVDALPNMPVNIWVGETDLAVVPDAWIPAGELTQVYSGTMDWDVGQNEAVFLLEVPYIYNGGNLVIMANRPMDTQYYSSQNHYYYTDTPEFPGRSVERHSDSTTFDPYAPPTGPAILDRVPNTTLLFNLDGLGSLEGYVYDSVGDPIAEAIVSLDDPPVSRLTNALGFYSYPGVFAGTYDMTAEKFGYGSTTVNDVEIIADQTTVQDFVLPDLIEVVVSGYVEGSELPGVGLAGAFVELDGYDHFETTTLADGTFSIPEVYSNHTYEVTISKESYTTYTGTAVVGGVDLDLGTLIIWEMMLPINGLTGEVIGNDVFLAWNTPVDEVFFDFEADDGGFIADPITAAWAWGEDTTLGSHSPTNVWVTAINSNYVNNADWKLDTPELPVPDGAQLTFWHNYHAEGWCDGGNVKISTDGGASWALITPTVAYPGSAIGLGGEPCYNSSNPSGWVQAAFDLTAYYNTDVMFRFHFGTDSSVTGYSGWAIDDMRIGVPENRIFLGYHVFRNTVQIAELSTTTLSYNDMDLVPDTYTYDVTGWYTSGDSDPQTVTLAVYPIEITGYVECSEFPGVGADSALVVVENDDFYYEATTVDGNFTITDILGDGINGIEYDVSISLEGYAGYDTLITVYDTNIDLGTVIIWEMMLPINGLAAEVIGDDVFLTWNEPVNAMFFDFEDNDGAFIADPATGGWSWGEDTGMGSYSPVNVWVTAINSNYINSANWKLDTPELPVPDGAQLTFWHQYDTESYWDGGNVKVSIDGGATWAIITPNGGYPEDAHSTGNAGIPGEPGYSDGPSGWVQAVFELTDYYNTEAIFRFHFGTDSSVDGYPGWAIDDVRVGAPEERVFLGYNIYRNTTFLASVPTDQLNYDDMDLDDGTYTYDVMANYTSGESDPQSITVAVYPNDVTGFVETSDNPGVGVDGALVVIENDEFYYEATTVAGLFTITDILGDGVNGVIYDVTISLESYQSYETEITVLDADIDMGTIVLLEFINPPGPVIAIENAPQTEVDLIWGMPGSGVMTEFLWDDGAQLGQLGYSGGSGTAIMGSLHNNDAQIHQISWLLTDEGGPHTTVCIYVFMLGADGLPDNDQLLFTVADVPNTDMEWNYYDFADPIDTPEGFYVALNAPGLFLALGTDDGVGDPFVFQPWTQVVTSDYTGAPDWHSIEEYGFPFNFMLRKHGYDYGSLDNCIGHTYVPKTRPQTVGIAYSENRRRDVGGPQWPVHFENATIDRNRSLENFRVYRLLEANQGSPDLWVTLEDSVAATDTTYTDTDWSTQPSGVYMWAVIAEYTGDILSPPSFSNTIETPDMYGEVDVTVTCNDGGTPNGATLIFEHFDGEPEHIYEFTVPANGVVPTFLAWVGDYTVTCDLSGYDSYESVGVLVISDGIDYDIELEEVTPPVVGLDWSVEDPNVHLTWMD